ncbi:MAG: PEP-CTERM sorting domain-containing protein [Phycisphaerae bacterium]|nr:PEP-CTERM sorting domain-containing protein [Phycisphaerae bacterium]
MNRLIGLSVLAVAMSLPAVSARAAWVVGAEVNFYADLARANAMDFGGYAVPIGAFNALGHAGTMGHVYGAVQPSNPYHGFFGAQWDGPVEVYTLSLTQLVDAGRQRPDVIYLYTDTNPANYIEIDLPATWWDETTIQGKDMVIDLTAFNGGKPILANNSYLLMAVQTMHPGGNDSNFGVLSYGFEAIAAGPADVNFNRDAIDVEFVGAYWNNPWRTNDGRVATYGSDTLTYWDREAPVNSLIVTYGEPQTIGSIGLALVGDANNRDCPKWVMIVPDGDLSRAQQIWIQEGMSAYGRYELPGGPMVGVTELTLLMPPGDDADAWVIRGDKYYGITEFQAFAPVPEPATMTLLALGGLAMLRRRK